MKRIYERDKEGRRYCRPCHERVPEHLTEITLTVPVDMTDADAFRRKLGEENRIHVSVTSLIIKAAANALEDFPLLYGCWEGDDRVRLPNPGEITLQGPVRVGNMLGFFTIEKASQKTLLEISEELDFQVSEVKLKKKGLEVPSSSIPSFNISNIGTLGPVESGGLSGLSSIVAFMGVPAILEKPAVKDG